MLPKLFPLFLFISSFCYSQISYIKNRDHINLNNWHFKKGIIYNAQSHNFDSSTWQQVSIPHTYSMDAINEIGYYQGQSWYRTNTSIPKTMKGKRIFLRFEGVGHDTKLYVNGIQIGKHSGGYSAFCYEITNAIDFDNSNSIAVNVTNEPNFKRIPVNDKLFNLYGGIYRPVQLFATEQTNIDPTHYASSGVFVTLKEAKKEIANIEIRTHISSKKEENLTLNYTIYDAKDNLVTQASYKTVISDSLSILTEHFTINNPIYWNGKKNPHLYKIKVEIATNGKKDEVIQKFGLKTFKVNPNEGSFLNNSPYRLYGVCMHQEWKQYGPALKPEQHQKDLEMVNEIGATALRLSHYQHSDLTYQQADEKGILVWAEIPFVHDYSGREGENAKQQLTELILQNYNHPSIYVWGLWNEVRAWKSKDEACVSLTKELKKIAHELDPNRLTTSASDRAIISNMGNISDLQAWNKYYGWYYGNYPDMATWLDESRKKYPEIALGISEYGIGGNVFQQDITKLEKPSGNYFPEPEQTKYHELTWKIIKDRPFVWSSFIWNMFDFSVAGWNRGGIPNLNHKGLVTYDRNTKKDAFYFYKANWSKEPVLHITNKRSLSQKTSIDTLKIYSNLPEVTLFINEKKILKKKVTSDIHITNFYDLKLNKGKNTIKVISKHKNNLFKDEFFFKL